MIIPRKALYNAPSGDNLSPTTELTMRKSILLAVSALALAFLSTGCSGPAYKLGRGMNNMTEFARLGDMRRSIEQAAVWNGPDAAFSFGILQGFNRSIVRTFLGVAEVVTFPVPTPTYDAFYVTSTYPGAGDVYIPGPYRKDQFWSIDFMTSDPKYPTNFKPGLLSDSIFATDTALGFSAGDSFPYIPGSRFHVFDY